MRESIVQSKFSRIKTQQPSSASYYEELEEELSNRICEAWDKTPNFGYKESDEVVKTFVKDLSSELFSDVPTLLNQDDIAHDMVLDFEDDDIDDYLTEI